MTTVATVNFTGRDFSAEYERLLTLLKSELPEYTDWNHNDAGIVLLRLAARETDLLNDYIDLVFNEGFLQTAQFRQSLIELGRLVDYLPELATSATTTLTLTRKMGMYSPTTPVTVPQFTPFARDDEITYLTIEEHTVPYSATPYDIPAIQGTLNSVTLTSASFENVDWSGFAKYDLGVNVAAGTVEISHGTSPTTTWTEVDSFYRSRSTDYHFMLELNGDTDSVWLVVGNGAKGAEPPESTDILVRYIVTDGATGNCGAGLIRTIPDGLYDTIDSVTNNIVANGGSASETTDSLRRQIPAVTRAQRRAVTHDDYEALVQHQPGVLWCQALDRNEFQFFPWEFVALYIVPDGGGPMNDLFKAGLLNEIGQWGHLLSWPGRYVLLDATEYPVDVTMRVWRATGYTENTVTQNITSALNTLFSLDARSIAETLSFIGLHQAVSSVAGVSVVEFVTPTSDVNPGNGNFIRPGTYTIQYQ